MKSFICDICEKAFTLNSNLKRHVASVHALQKKECEFCGQNFNRSDALLHHKFVYHDVQSNANVINVVKCNPTPIAAVASTPNVSASSTQTTSAAVAAYSKPTGAGVVSVSTPTASTSTAAAVMARAGSVSSNNGPNLGTIVANTIPNVYCNACKKDIITGNWSYHIRTNAHKNNSGEIVNEHITRISSAFNERIESFMYKNTNEGLLNAEVFLDNAKKIFIPALQGLLQKHINIKFNIELFCEYVKMCEDEMTIDIKSHQTKMVMVQQSSDLNSILDEKRDNILTKMSEFQERDSGWALIKILHMEININQYKPIKGSHYIPLPKKLMEKHACVNVKNDDENCFKWAMISALYPVIANPHRCSNYNLENIESSVIHLNNGKTLNFERLIFPLRVKDIKIFEENNPEISVNVFGYDDELKSIVGPFYFTKEEKSTHVNLLLLQETDRFHYVWIKHISRGKFAAVRRAVHKNSGVHFAAKFLKRRRRAQSSDKEIKHEIAVLMLCDGADNIVKLNAVHESRSDTALLLELATGGELQTFLDNEECLSEAQARICMREVLKALQFLHNRSIAHLDLKPQNILLSGERIEDGLKLCDFGISRVVAEGTNVREIVGTPDYVAPEVLQYEPLSLLTDIWSVGVLTYVLLSGFSPFGGETKQETFLNISQCALTFPDKLFGGVSAQAIDFIRRSLRIKPSDRMTAAGCLEHIWLKDECAIDRQIFNNISKKTAAAEDGEDDGVEEDEDELEHDESFEEELEELDEEYEDDEPENEIPNADNVTNGHKMDASDAVTNDMAATTTLHSSNGKYNMIGMSSSCSTKGKHSAAILSTNCNGNTKTTTAIIAMPATRATTIPLTNGLTVVPAQHQQLLHVAGRRHSSDANKENTYLATKKIAANSAVTPPSIAKKPTSTTTATATIVIAPTITTTAATNQVVATITLPMTSAAANNSAVCCIFPDAPTTPKVIRKAPTTDASPTSVKALVKKFQLEGSNSTSTSRATSPAPAAAAATTTNIAAHLKESLQQNQLHIITNSNTRNGATIPRRASTNTIVNGYSRDNEKMNTTSRKSTTSLPAELTAIVHQKSSPTSLLKKSNNSAATPKAATSSASNYKTTCVFCLTSGSNNTAASSTGCRHSAAGSNAIVSHSSKSSSSSSNSATSTAAAILLSNHKQLQHHHHVHHTVHHVQKSAANNLSLDQGIIC